MKKSMLVGIMLALLSAVSVQAVSVTAYPLPIQSQAAHLGANYEVIVKYSDFTTTTTNTAQTLTMAVTAGQGFTLLYAKTITEFVGAAGTDSVTVVVGDDDDIDQFLTVMQLATESTEVSGQFGTTKAEGVFYEAADTIDFTFTPNAENSMAGMTAGEIRFYIKLVQ